MSIFKNKDIYKNKDNNTTIAKRPDICALARGDISCRRSALFFRANSRQQFYSGYMKLLLLSADIYNYSTKG